ncbi:hypothetical protein CORMATOL_02457 [Corynebacterium matruchotii ATCC 33806]|uniref:Uncharacterized protein n=1 Tax=Corynebacterium matruchotii ATCC 33806 TaxID=566549 RepID=C0E625_9CORY|nr:hypothetical protein CORMATOL_02457 [Corynebacterium matruchotii ATCC 33806]
MCWYPRPWGITHGSTSLGVVFPPAEIEHIPSIYSKNFHY